MDEEEERRNLSSPPFYTELLAQGDALGLANVLRGQGKDGFIQILLVTSKGHHRGSNDYDESSGIYLIPLEVVLCCHITLLDTMSRLLFHQQQQQHQCLFWEWCLQCNKHLCHLYYCTKTPPGHPFMQEQKSPQHTTSQSQASVKPYINSIHEAYK
jgi:hypothetical protein